MVEQISFSTRFIVDEYFIGELLQDRENAVRIIKMLSDIHSKSKHYPFTHNIIFDASFKAAIRDKLLRGDALLGAMHPEAIPSYLTSEPDFACQVVKHAIDMASKKPYKVIILTSNAQLKIYQENVHYKKDAVSSFVEILPVTRALAYIEAVATYRE